MAGASTEAEQTESSQRTVVRETEKVIATRACIRGVANVCPSSLAKSCSHAAEMQPPRCPNPENTPPAACWRGDYRGPGKA